MPPNPPPRPPLTHFLCIPLSTPTSRPQLQSSLHRFAADATKPDAEGKQLLPVKAIRPVGAIHFTIGVMSLQTPERVEAACDFLRGLDVLAILRAAAAAAAETEPAAKEEEEGTKEKRKSTTARADNRHPTKISPEPPRPTTTTTQKTNSDLPPLPTPLTISLTSLHPLPPLNPQKTTSLYATPTPLPPIQTLAQSLHTAFLSAGFLLPDPRPLLLHATVANTIYAKNNARGGKGVGKGRGRGTGIRGRDGAETGKWERRFDSTDICERWAGAVWVQGMRVDRVSVCEMGARVLEVEGETGEGYLEVCSVGLP